MSEARGSSEASAHHEQKTGAFQLRRMKLRHVRELSEKDDK
jgi:hypothetical protein